MSEQRQPDPYTLVNGRDVPGDPGMAQLRRYLPVLAVIAAPFTALGSGTREPLNPLDPVNEWRLLLDTLDGAARLQTDASTPLAVARLVPPTAKRLGEALSAGGPDAFRVVHLVCYGERDMLYLEDEDGTEAYAVADLVTGLFAESRAQIVIMDGCFSRLIAQGLFEKTQVAAVIGSRRKVAPASAAAFGARFYAAISTGQSVQQAFKLAAGVLDQYGHADRYELVVRDEGHEVVLDLPSPGDRAVRPLIADGQPPLVDVPLNAGFIGRWNERRTLAADLKAGRAYAIVGPAGVGKSWLAADFVGRFGWNFPGGVLWFKANAQTTARDVIARLADLLELPPYAPDQKVLAALAARGVLLVLDQLDTMASGDELQRLCAFCESIDPGSSSWVLLTVRDLIDPLPDLVEHHICSLGPLDSRSALTLAMQRAVERGIDALDVDTIDEFQERTLNLPWLIIRALDLIESDGIGAALDDLAGFKPDMPDPLGLYMARRVKLLPSGEDSPLNLLIRTQGLPDAFDGLLAGVLAGEHTPDYIRLLVHDNLLVREGTLYTVPPTVHAYIRGHYPLTPEQQDRIDEYVLRMLVRAWTANDSPGSKRAQLNNARAIFQRQSRRESTVNPAVIALALVKAAPAFDRAGLAGEFVSYARPVRERLSEGSDFARLQMVLGQALARLPGQDNEAGWLLDVARTVNGLDRDAYAETSLSYGRYLLERGQPREAEGVLAGALQTLLRDKLADVRQAASLAHEWANTLVAQNRLDEAVARFDAALAGYAHAKRADLSVAAQRDLAAVLVRLGDLDRADDLLRRALATDSPPLLMSEVRRQFADLQARRGEWATAEDELSATLPDLLSGAGLATLAGVYHELGRIQARLGRLDDAAANAARCARLSAYDLPAQAAAVVTLGQVRLVQGDTVTAQQMLHRALDLAASADDPAVLWQAAGLLVRLHQIRARRAPHGDRLFRQNTREQASFTREVLAGLGLGEHAAALDEVIHQLP